MTLQGVGRYAGAVGLTLIGLGITLLLHHQRGVPDALVFAGTVALCARFFGTGPSLLASAISILAIDIMLPPAGNIELTHPEEIDYLIVFIILVLLISGTTASLRRAQAMSDALARRSSRLLEVTTALSEAPLPRDVAAVVMGPGLAVAEATSAMVGVMEGDTLRILDRRGSLAGRVIPETTITRDGDGPMAEALRTHRPVWLESREQWQARFPAAFGRVSQTLSANAIVALPLLHGDELVGGLVFGFAAQTAFGAADRTFAQLVAQSVGVAMARARTLESEQRGRLQAESLARTREEVLGVVAHDLRNPLSVVGTTVDALTKLDLDPPMRAHLLAAGGRAVRHMNRLIADLLDVVRLETGHLSLETDVVPVAAILDEAADAAGHLADEKNVSFSIDRPATGLQLRADRERLGQVLGNLIGNAIKFTPAGGKVTLSARADEDNVTFEVADTGPGLSPEGQAHLFERFWQARSDRRGVGLGLPIAKGIVEAHGGRIWVESKPGAGSHFFFAIPNDRAARGGASAAA